MTKEQYFNKRNDLVKKAEGLIDSGELEKFDELSNEIKKLDQDYQNEALARTNMEALKDSVKIVSLENKSVNVTGTTTILDTTNTDDKSVEYTNAWAKFMMNKVLNDSEQSVMDMTNAAMTTESHAILVPETVVAGIWKEVGEQYPLYADVLKTNVKGNLTVLKSDASTDAKWYDEATATEEGSEDFSKATLHGCELSRAISVSWKLREMAIDEFIPFITMMLAEKMGAAAAYGTFDGKGVKSDDSEHTKDEPRGIKTALIADSTKAQIITVTGNPTFQTITKMISLVKGTYKNGSKFYAKGEFVWNVLANITDKNGKPYFVPDTTAGGVGRMFGFVVEEDDTVDTLLFGNANRGYHMNINKNMTLDTEDHKKDRVTDYIAYAIMDGNVRSLKAFSYLEITKAA